MKIIHCADLHLDSKMNTHLSKEKANERKAEILNTFNKMVTYAKDNDVSAIIIAGDLYDKKTISITAKNTVFNAICNNPNIDFYYLKGNHDAESFLSSIDEIPNNLKMFDDNWKTYSLNDNITITGVELSKNTPASIYTTLMLDTNNINIVTLHGQESEYSSKDDAEIIGFKDLRNKGIDYLALGHIHGYKISTLDARGKYCYCGCLEGRGFDECGEHGFVLLDIDENTRKINDTFVPFASRCLHEVKVDITDCEYTIDISKAIEDKLDTISIPIKDIVKITLVGEVGVECEKNIDLLEKQFEDDFYFVRIKDELKFKVDYNQFKNDKTLKGEFVRTVIDNPEILEQDKPIVIRYGIQSLMGEDLA